MFSESFSSRPSRLESIPEAWLVFPEDKQLDRQRLNNIENNNTINSRMSRAIPVSLRNNGFGIGSRLQVLSGQLSIEFPK